MSTLLHRLGAWAESEPNSIAQRYKKDGQWVPITTQEYCDRVYWLALFFESKGMTSEDVGTILAYNRCEWVHTDLAFLLIGAKSAGIYPNSSPKDISYVLNHTESRFLAVGGRDYFSKICDNPECRQALERVALILVFDNDVSISPKAVSYTTAIEEGKKLAKKKGAKMFSDFLNQLDPKKGGFMIYTSGTTGNPKGALLSQENMVSTIDLGVKYWGLRVGNGSLFSFLPLCHIAEKIQNIGGGISLRYTVNFCTAFENVAAELPEVQPTLLLCVPRLWEKMMEGVMAKLSKSKGVKKKMAEWALGVGAKANDARFAGRKLSLVEQLEWKAADRLVISKIRHALGLAQAEVLASGAAALPAHVCRWFRSLGLDILEVFGQTESTGIICMTVQGMDCAGTVGRPIPGLEVKLAEDGEILTRGPNLFKGYFKDQGATDQVLEGGWLHTGDLGEWDKNKLMRIRGRKKEVMKTSGGKMIAPLPIEEALKASPIISQVCMVGDGRKYLSALITLSEAKLAELSASGVTGNGVPNGVTITTPDVVGEVKTHIEKINGSLASYEQIKKFVILSKEFSIAEGEMTPTLKMKRNVIESKYRDIIEGLYNGNGV